MDYINRVILLPFKSLDKIQGRVRHVVQTSVADNLTQRSLEKKVREEQMKLDELEEHGQCCICHQQGQKIEGRRKHDGGMTLLEGRDAVIVSAALGISVRGYLCPTCEIIRSKIKTRLQAKELKQQQQMLNDQRRHYDGFSTTFQDPSMMGAASSVAAGSRGTGLQFVPHSTRNGIVHHLIPGQDPKMDAENEKKNKLLEVKVAPFVPGRRGIASGPLSLELFRGVTAWPTHKPLDLSIIAPPSSSSLSKTNDESTTTNTSSSGGVHMTSSDHITLCFGVRSVPKLKTRRGKSMDGEEFEYYEEVFSDSSDYFREDDDEEEEEEDEEEFDDCEANNTDDNNKKKKSKKNKPNSSSSSSVVAVEVVTDENDIKVSDELLQKKKEQDEDRNPRVRAIRKHHHHHHRNNDTHKRERSPSSSANTSSPPRHHHDSENQILFFKLVQLDLRDIARKRRQLKRDHLERLRSDYGVDDRRYKIGLAELEKEEQQEKNDGVVYVSDPLPSPSFDTSTNSNRSHHHQSEEEPTTTTKRRSNVVSLTTKEKRKLEAERRRMKHIAFWEATCPIPVMKLIGRDSTGTFLLEVFERRRNDQENDDKETKDEQEEIRIGCCSFRIEDLKLATTTEQGPLELIGTRSRVVGQLYLKNVTVHRYVMPIDPTTGETIYLPIIHNGDIIDTTNNNSKRTNNNNNNNNNQKDDNISTDDQFQDHQDPEPLPQWTVSALLKRKCDACRTRYVSLYHAKYKELLCIVCKPSRRHQKQCISLTAVNPATGSVMVPDHDTCLSLMMIVCDARPSGRKDPRFQQDCSLFPNDRQDLFLQQEGQNLFSSSASHNSSTGSRQRHHHALYFSEAEGLLNEDSSGAGNDRRRLKSATLFAGRHVRFADERRQRKRTVRINNKNDDDEEYDGGEEQEQQQVDLFAESWIPSPISPISSSSPPVNLLSREQLLEEIHAQISPDSRRTDKNYSPKSKQYKQFANKITISLFPNQQGTQHSSSSPTTSLSSTSAVSPNHQNQIQNQNQNQNQNNNNITQQTTPTATATTTMSNNNNNNTLLNHYHTYSADTSYHDGAASMISASSSSAIAPLPVLKEDLEGASVTEYDLMTTTQNDDDDSEDEEVNDDENEDEDEDYLDLNHSLPRLSMANLLQTQQQQQQQSSGGNINNPLMSRFNQQYQYQQQQQQRPGSSAATSQITNVSSTTQYQNYIHSSQGQGNSQQQLRIGTGRARSNNSNMMNSSSFYCGSISPDSSISAISSVMLTTPHHQSSQPPQQQQHNIINNKKKQTNVNNSTSNNKMKIGLSSPSTSSKNNNNNNNNNQMESPSTSTTISSTATTNQQQQFTYSFFPSTTATTTLSRPSSASQQRPTPPPTTTQPQQQQKSGGDGSNKKNDDNEEGGDDEQPNVVVVSPSTTTTTSTA